MDRANAIRLLKALVAAGANSNTLMVKAWVHDIAVRDVSLRGTELSSALAYAEGQGWIADGPQTRVDDYHSCRGERCKTSHYLRGTS